MTRFLVVLIVLVCGKTVDAQVRANQSRTLSGATGADFREADLRAELELQKFEWEKGIHLSVPGTKLAFEDKADDPETAKENDIVNLHRIEFRVTQIIGKQSFTATTSLKDGLITYVFYGVSTADLSEGSRVKIVSPLIRSKNFTYTTVLGASKTVKCFRFFNEEEQKKAKEIEAKFAAEQEKKNRESFEKNNPRYVLQNGETFHGEFIKILKGKYQFRNVEKSIVEYELEDFAEDSRKQVLEEVKKARRK